MPSDPAILKRLYRPDDVPHHVLPEREDEHAVHRIEVEGVTVRYLEDMDAIMVTVEGDLPEETIARLREDLLGKLEKLEETKYRWIQHRP